MSSVTDWVSTSSGLGVYAVVGALVFCEDALFFGFVLPGETAVVLGGVVASQGRVSVYWMCAVVVFAAIAGDSVGYEVGNRFGPRILETKPLRGHRERIGKAEELIRRRGPAAVFLGRFVAFFRALMPALAGISRMPYRVFLAYNAAGGLVWGVGFTLLGYYAGDAYKRVERTAGTAVAVVVAVVVVAAFVYWEIRRHRKQAGEQEQDGGPDDADGNGSGDGSDGDGSARPERPDGPGGSHRLDGDGRSEHDGH
ncbi:membrane protein DedA, SNARE-associated domain [Actinacidiphila yanglinensis]|uniref:Membrane protein DedA, SNARE-associated domain n=1 Tax=Actinacidiphila yanglinensis TaxID=310779 RepID=A0A1H6D9K0_9ACTN|nr:DedA family protein [Actinacidiphila yanglinensis]SEG82051.1 membrane protein DedA, SNARE-associated domain [Actinacidiphila yanglinensis]